MEDYQRIEKAINFIRENFRNQPELEDIARHIHLSPFHFQRLFKDWAGVSPKKFLQYISVEYAKTLLLEKKTLADTSFETGLTGTGRLHDLFIQIEAMTPGEYQHGGKHLHIYYSTAETLFGDILIGSTNKGICHISFVNGTAAILELKTKYPSAMLEQKKDLHQQNVLEIFKHTEFNPDKIKLYLKGTPFQIKVWSALLEIREGSLTSYQEIAQRIGKPKASRAVGTAIGNNPIAYIIPCHRVITGSGKMGGYHWGLNRKTAMIGWEAAKIQLTVDR
jgi:AraC family transcriptional regulator, regulatory protein of adaptative response / methylated-DNA-[protein]-cysteine methyltransferase